jgi:hypothetical protein
MKEGLRWEADLSENTIPFMEAEGWLWWLQEMATYPCSEPA